MSKNPATPSKASAYALTKTNPRGTLNRVGTQARRKPAKPKPKVKSADLPKLQRIRAELAEFSVREEERPKLPKAFATPAPASARPARYLSAIGLGGLSLALFAGSGTWTVSGVLEMLGGGDVSSAFILYTLIAAYIVAWAHPKTHWTQWIPLVGIWLASSLFAFANLYAMVDRAGVDAVQHQIALAGIERQLEEAKAIRDRAEAKFEKEAATGYRTNTAKRKADLDAAQAEVDTLLAAMTNAEKAQAQASAGKSAMMNLLDAWGIDGKTGALLLLAAFAFSIDPIAGLLLTWARRAT